MGKSGGGDTEATVRYAQYLEDHHSNLLNIYQWHRSNIVNNTDGLNPNPYLGLGELVESNVDDAFMGTKGWQFSDNVPIYGLLNLMTSLNLDDLLDARIESMIDYTPINNLVASYADTLDEEIDEVSLPRYATGMRDMNGVLSSTFVVGKAMIETGKIRALTKYDAELRAKMLPLVLQHWSAKLEWLKNLPIIFMDVFARYHQHKYDIENHNVTMQMKKELWPFTVGEYYRLAIGTMQGATNTSTDVDGGSKIGRSIGGAASGAAAGWMLGGPIGAGIGGVLGLASSLF